MKNVKNKSYAVALMGLSALLLLIEKDATAMILMAFISVPMFFSKRDWVS